MNYNYPIRVLKKKLTDPEFKPFMFDGASGQLLSPPVPRNGKKVKRAVLTLITLITMVAMYFILLSPLVDTTVARLSVSQELKHIGDKEVETVSKIVKSGEVLYQNSVNGLVTIQMKVANKDLNKVTKLAMSIGTIKEVTTDGDVIRIVFLSSES